MIRLLTIAACLSGVVALSSGCSSDNGAKSPSYPKSVAEEPVTATEGMPAEREGTEQRLDIVDLAASDPNFSTLVTALTKAELVDTLRGEGPFTVFAPTNAAFAKIPAETLDAILADKEKLTAILIHHVVNGRVLAADVMGLQTATMLDGKVLRVDTSAGVRIGAATVEKTDLQATNGVIHVIDTVLIPE